MGRPKGSTNKRTQTAQQDMQQQSMIEEKSKEMFNQGVAAMIAEKRDYAQPVTDTTAAAMAEATRLQAERDAATAEKLSFKPMSIQQRAELLRLAHEMKIPALAILSQSNPVASYDDAKKEIARLLSVHRQKLVESGKVPSTQPQTLPQKTAQGAVSKQTTSEMVASLWTKNTDDFPEDLNSLTKIEARKILGVPFICVGIEEKIGGPDSLNPGKPFWTMKLLFDGTGDEEFSCNVSGGYIANQIKKIASFVSYEHPLYRTFELVPEYITAEQKFQNPAYPAFWLKQWRSVLGDYDVTFAY